MSAPQVPRPRRRLTQAEFDAELKRSSDDTPALNAALAALESDRERVLRTPTGRRRSWWMRGWKR